MEWREISNHFTMATVESGKSIEKSMMELCRHIHDCILPANEGVSWNCLRVELWSDSGRMIAYPAIATNTDRIENAGCQIVFDELLMEYEKLADSDLNDDDFVNSLRKVEREWIGSFIDAARQTGLMKYKIELWSGEEKQIISDT